MRRTLRQQPLPQQQLLLARRRRVLEPLYPVCCRLPPLQSPQRQPLWRHLRQSGHPPQLVPLLKPVPLTLDEMPLRNRTAAVLPSTQTRPPATPFLTSFRVSRVGRKESRSETCSRHVSRLPLRMMPTTSPFVACTRRRPTRRMVELPQRR